MLVAELHQVLMDHEVTCHRTRFSLQLGGVVLDSLTELRSVQGIQDGALIKLVEGNDSIRPPLSSFSDTQITLNLTMSPTMNACGCILQKIHLYGVSFYFPRPCDIN